METNQPHRSPQKISDDDLLNLLSVTMVTSHILSAAGICMNIRIAQRQLRKLYASGHTQSHKYPTYIGYQKFHYLTKETIGKLRKEEDCYHEIKKGLITHDGLTALFLSHLFRSGLENNITIQWYQPFQIGAKVCDGGVTLCKDGLFLQSLLLESDTGSHDLQEMEEKINAYLPFLEDKPHRNIVFLVIGSQRESALRKLLQTVLKNRNEEHYTSRIFFIRPLRFATDTDVITKLHIVEKTNIPEGTTSSKDVVPDEPTSENSDVQKGSSL